jgi:mannosyltransferase
MSFHLSGKSMVKEKIYSWFEKNFSSIVMYGFLADIIVLASFLRFYQIGRLSFWNDEIFQFQVATNSFKNIFSADPYMSLFTLFIHLLINIFPNRSETFFRSISAIFSIASIPVVFLLGRKFGVNRKQSIAIGLTAAFLVTINAFHIQYAQEFRSYSLVFLLTSISTFLLIKAVEQPDNSHYLVWYTITNVAAAYCHLFATVIIVSQIITMPFLFSAGKKYHFFLKRIVFIGITMFFLILPIVIIAYKNGASNVSWIVKPTFKNIVSLSIEVAGNQGMSLLVYYLSVLVVGLFVYIKFLFQKDIILNWKFTLIVNCLFLPVIMVYLVSRIITPIFVDRYLLLIMPYAAILAAVGITAIVTSGWKKPIDRIATSIVGIIVAVEFVSLSIAGIHNYFGDYQKEDWRKISQFMMNKCENSYRLYYMTYLEKNAIYYNDKLKSQALDWDDFLQSNPNSEKIVSYLPHGYGQLCLVLGHIINTNNKLQSSVIQTAIQTKFSKQIEYKYNTIDIIVYSQ